jgi:hypothetical protein
MASVSIIGLSIPHTTNNTHFAPAKNGNLSGGNHINFPDAFLQNESGVKIRIK